MVVAREAAHIRWSFLKKKEYHLNLFFVTQSKDT